MSRLGKLQRLFLVALFSALAIGAAAQSKTVSGTVTDKTGETVIGASVVVKGTTNGTITDIDGKFTISNVPDNGIIQVSFVGYKTQDIPAGGKSVFHITLEEDAEILDEVVVVGYGVQKKSDVTGALTQVTEKQSKSARYRMLYKRCKVKLPACKLHPTTARGNWVMYASVVIVPLMQATTRYM